MADDAPLTRTHARAVLGLTARASADQVREAFRKAAKAAHPDRPGGSPERFREVMEAYRLLEPRPNAPDRLFQPPAPATPLAPAIEILTLSPLVAMTGGSTVHALKNGRTLRITLPAGLRTGDKVRAGGAELEVVVERDGATLVRGDDLWITLDVDPAVLKRGGRVAVETPLGRRIVWIDRKAGARGLVRLEGQGLPARASHKQGCLFLRLTPCEHRIDSAARALLRRFAAAWAA